MELTASEKAQFASQGFVVLRGCLDEADLAPLDAAYEQRVADVAERLVAQGRIRSDHSGLPHGRRLAALVEELGPQAYDGFQIHELQGEWPEAFDLYQARLPAAFEFMFGERLGAALESLLGTPELTVHPSQHVRPYLPRRGPGLPQPNQAAWHQDRVVYRREADASQIVTCWCPLVDCDANSGCLRMIPGVREMLQTVDAPDPDSAAEFDGQPSGIEPAALAAAGTPVDVPMKRGDVVLFSSLVPHAGLPNDSDRIRWSIELRFQASGTPTGRPAHPEVVVRSADPTTVQRSYEEWSDRWVAALDATRELTWQETLGEISGSVEWAELWKQGRSEEVAARNRTIAEVDSRVGSPGTNSRL
eukprot:COSAG06_NODE_8191_length_2244_cov_1.617249_2_plen_361_part_00